MRDYSFGNFLHELRMRTGLTQYQLGALVGVSDKAVSKWENGSSKPKSGILFKLSEVLGISVDELMSCKYRSDERNNLKGIFTMKNQLWNKADEAMRNRYGNPVPIEIASRFYNEQAQMQSTDMIVYFDMLATLRSEAKAEGEHIRVIGGTGASFVAYLLGATDINPLKPHYYCKSCQKVIFDDSVRDGWDLPKKLCSCGKTMVCDGHNIPFETYRHVIRRNTSFLVTISPSFLEKAKGTIKSYFKDCKLAFADEEDKNTVTVSIASSSESPVCSVVLCVDFELERLKTLERITATSSERISFCQDEVCKGFTNGAADEIPSFRGDFIQDMLAKAQPSSFGDLIQICGLSHGTGTWHGNAESLIEKGMRTEQTIAYRDDVFNYIQEKMISKGFTDTGLAYKVMKDACRGIYAKSGVPEELKEQLKSLGVEDRFIGSIEKIKYLFPKAHGIIYAKSAAVLMWYKIHYPKEFGECMRITNST